MLFLQLPAGATDPPSVVPISDEAAQAFERALLAPDDAAREQELRGALASDKNTASWALRVAEVGSQRTVNQIEDAARWLGSRLASALATSLNATVEESGTTTIAWRLPALVIALHAAEQRTADFDRRLEREKLDSLKELAYGASHEINNPLANIAARAQTLLEDEANPERQRKLVAIHRQAMRAHEMISDLMLFARPPKLQLARRELGAIVEKVVGEFRELADELGVELRCDAVDKALPIDVDETQLAVAIGALVKNSLEATRGGGHVRVGTRRILHDGADWAEVLVCDDGPGLSEEVRSHLFDPFFSGREAGRGLGFGATKCWRIVTDHGGDVVVHSRANDTEIGIQLPLAANRS